MLLRPPADLKLTEAPGSGCREPRNPEPRRPPIAAKNPANGLAETETRTLKAHFGHAANVAEAVAVGRRHAAHQGDFDGDVAGVRRGTCAASSRSSTRAAEPRT